MAQFGLLYIGEPQFDDPEQAQAHQKCWFDWIASLGDAIVNPGMPMGPPTRVTANGVAPGPTENRLTGLTIIQAQDIDAAIAIAKTSPYVEVATVDVVEIYQMG